MKENKENKYTDKMNTIVKYIYENLEEDLSLEKISEVACFSRFHFHRQFSSFTGVNLHKFVKLLRMKRASYQLVFNPELKIIDIALNAKFESHESFSRTFKKLYGQTPSKFRNEPQWKPWLEKYKYKSIEKNNIGKISMEIEIVDFQKTTVAVKEHRGAVELLNDSIAEFITWRKSNDYSPVKTSQTFGIAYDDPKSTKPDDFRFDICGSTKSNVSKNPQNVLNKIIPGGRCVKIRHLGSHENMDAKIHYLYGEWLPANDEELRNYPCFFHYINLFPEVSEHELITDIYLPLKNK
jgi:AraC family transcriptional regulator